MCNIKYIFLKATKNMFSHLVNLGLLNLDHPFLGTVIHQLEHHLKMHKMGVSQI